MPAKRRGGSGRRVQSADASPPEDLELIQRPVGHPRVETVENIEVVENVDNIVPTENVPIGNIAQDGRMEDPQQSGNPPAVEIVDTSMYFNYI